MRVLFAASEITPYAKVGGLGDVIAALPQELEKQGVDVQVVLPLYDVFFQYQLTQVMVSEADGNKFTTHFLGKEEECRLFSLTIPNTQIKLFLIQNNTYLSNGSIYLSPSAFAEGDDELKRFMFFSKAVFTLFERGFFTHDIVHAHDYHTSYLLYLFKNQKALGTKPKLILTIHNLGNQGVTGDDLGIEIDGKQEPHNLLSMGIASADKVVPVSSHYTTELLTGQFCFGLEKIIQAYSEKFSGIVNGVDVDFYNPRTDNTIGFRFDEQNFASEKTKNKLDLLSKFIPEGLVTESTFLVGFVGRLVAQKNIQLICDSLGVILKSVANRHHIVFMILGVGDAAHEKMLEDLAGQFPENIVFVKAFDEDLAHKIFASSDLFLIPSVFEPCGLTQLIAMRYGALPLATKVGGLVDTINERSPGQTGFFIREATPGFVSVHILDLYTLWSNAREMWDEIVVNALTADFSWQKSAQKYIELYRS